MRRKAGYGGRMVQEEETSETLKFSEVLLKNPKHSM
jgi:hypothetical protein